MHRSLEGRQITFSHVYLEVHIVLCESMLLRAENAPKLCASCSSSEAISTCFFSASEMLRVTLRA